MRISVSNRRSCCEAAKILVGPGFYSGFHPYLKVKLMPAGHSFHLRMRTLSNIVEREYSEFRPQSSVNHQYQIDKQVGKQEPRCLLSSGMNCMAVSNQFAEVFC